MITRISAYYHQIKNDTKVNVVGGYNFNGTNGQRDPFSQTYNPGWQDPPNFKLDRQNEQAQPSHRASSSSAPFSSRLARPKELVEDKDKELLEMLRKVEINIPLLDAVKQIPKYAKFLKQLCTRKRQAKEKERMVVSQSVSAILQKNLPEKQKDPEPTSISSASMLLGRTFMETTKTKIDMDEGTLSVEFEGEEVVWDVYDDDEDDLTDLISLAPKVELKELSDHLKYAYLGEVETFPVIISKNLTDEHEKQVVKVLQTYKLAIGWTLADIKCISPVILINQEDQQKMNFTCPYGIFVFRMMPFGLCNASDTFQGCMMSIFSKFIESYMEDFLSNLSRVLERYIKSNLVLNFEKCHFMPSHGIVLGHIISEHGIEVDFAKVNVIAKLSYPTNMREVQSFLRHAGFYHWFIKDFSKIAQSMVSLLHNDVSFEFYDECKTIFDVLKNAQSCAIVILAPRWDLPFDIMCNVSNHAVRAVLG
ncbi:uncharacterized protein LOC120073520 [Benincasa hispida]|uniref:uncharacterized protein LOC120073520 n=1 Tax=Benincasa hispida TaxID=102211 RepID=UPI0019022CB5|nr:uncharacterized protein LOC120073520 [Benincasa hispida]